MYSTGFPLRKYLFNLHEGGAGLPVGTVAKEGGTLSREFVGESDFQPIPASSPLYDEDTIVTDAGGGATLVLNDGSQIQLGPSTMIRLIFETRFTLGGIVRSANIDVVGGEVTADAMAPNEVVLRTAEGIVTVTSENAKHVHAGTARPKGVAVQPLPSPSPELVAVASPSPIPTPNPSPSPLLAVFRIDLTSPKNGAKLEIPKGSQAAELPVKFQWRIRGDDQIWQVSLNRTDGDQVKKIFEEKVATKDGKGLFPFVLDEPGSYEWEIRTEKGEPLPHGKSKAAFTVNPVFEGITTNEPLIGGEKVQSNIYTGKKAHSFDITLNWEPYQLIQTYTVLFYTSETARKPILQKSVEGTRYTLNKNKVFAGKIFYRVTAPLDKGFTVISNMMPFSFNYLPPFLVLPVDHTAVSNKGLIADTGGNMLFTWQKTNYTDRYQFQVSTDTNFKKIYLEKQQRENFAVTKPLPPGQYYWRVRSFSGKMVSGYSKFSELIVNP